MGSLHGYIMLVPDNFLYVNYCFLSLFYFCGEIAMSQSDLNITWLTVFITCKVAVVGTQLRHDVVFLHLNSK